MKLSVVSTLYCSAAHIGEFHRRASEAARALAGNSYEIVLVNDGSPDDSLDRALLLSQSDPHTIVVDLSRNFGHHKAMMTGLAQATGERIFLLDSDLEEDPEILAAFDARMAQEKADVVYGVQSDRKGGFFERWSGAIFYRIFRAVSGLSLPDNVVVARLMTRRYLDALLLHEEREVFIAGLWLITGFCQSPHPIVKRTRGDTTYSLRRRISQFADSITSFSNKPLVAIFAIGCSISLFSSLFVTYLVVQWSLLDRPPEGWTSVIASVWLLGGFLMSSIGVIGIYIAKIFSETKRRPYTIIRAIHRQKTDDRA